MAVLEDLAVAVEGLLGGRAVRWSPRPDLSSELVAAVLLASPSVAERVVATLQVLSERAVTLTELVDGLDVVAVRFGQDGEGETCEALLDLSDRLREWRDDG